MKTEKHTRKEIISKLQGERSLGPMGVALFANGVEDAAMQADVVGISELLRMTAV